MEFYPEVTFNDSDLDYIFTFLIDIIMLSSQYQVQQSGILIHNTLIRDHEVLRKHFECLVRPLKSTHYKWFMVALMMDIYNQTKQVVLPVNEIFDLYVRMIKEEDIYEYRVGNYALFMCLTPMRSNRLWRCCSLGCHKESAR